MKNDSKSKISIVDFENTNLEKSSFQRIKRTVLSEDVTVMATKRSGRF